MGTFSGPQSRGAARRAKEQRREEAIDRQKEYDATHPKPTKEGFDATEALAEGVVITIQGGGGGGGKDSPEKPAGKADDVPVKLKKGEAVMTPEQTKRVKRKGKRDNGK